MQFRNKQKVVDVIKNNRRHKKNYDSRHSQQADRDGEASAEIHS